MKTSEAANLVFQWIFVLNSVKQKFFPVCIVKSFGILGDNSFTMIFMLDIKYRFTCGESKRL